MSIAEQILERQKTLSFEEVVCEFITKVDREETTSNMGDKIYTAIWTLKDGSTLTLEDSVFRGNNDAR